MSQAEFEAVDAYLGGLFAPEDEVLRQGKLRATEAGLPEIQVSAVLGKLLFVLAKSVGARRILEIGTLGGYSGAWLARALPSEGRLTTLEYDPRHAEVARTNLDAAGVGALVDIHVGAALDTLPSLSGPFDLVFIDADKQNYPAYLEHAIRLSRPGALIVADNVVRQGRILETTDDPVLVGTRTFNERFANDPRLDACAFQIVGAKGWDGLAIAVVK